MLSYPDFFRVRQNWPRPKISDLPESLEAELAKLRLADKKLAGASIAIAVGSRGIAQLGILVRGIVQHFTSLGAKPFIVPAMGSHGGATADGQRHILEAYGVTEQFCGCPIRSSMETVVVDRAADGFPIHFDRLASEADHVFVCARVKPHTWFVGSIESGLMKMLLVGLGKHDGAKIFHRAVQEYSFEQIVRGVADRVLNRCRIIGGLAVVENAYKELAQLTAVQPADFPACDQQLLVLAKQNMPRLPFQHVHLLIVDEIGKDISGAGMDTNVVGRKFNDHAALPDEYPKVRRIIVRRLTQASNGSAHGIGIAEFCKASLIRSSDRAATWINGLTSGHMSGSVYPIHFETDRELLDAALPTIGLTEPPDAKLLWIKNTIDLAEVECSAAYLPEAKTRPDLEILTDLRPLSIAPDGNLPDFKG